MWLLALLGGVGALCGSLVVSTAESSAQLALFFVYFARSLVVWGYVRMRSVSGTGSGVFFLEALLPLVSAASVLLSRYLIDTRPPDEAPVPVLLANIMAAGVTMACFLLWHLGGLERGGEAAMRTVSRPWTQHNLGSVSAAAIFAAVWAVLCTSLPGTVWAGSIAALEASTGLGCLVINQKLVFQNYVAVSSALGPVTTLAIGLSSIENTATPQSSVNVAVMTAVCGFILSLLLARGLAIGSYAPAPASRGPTPVIETTSDSIERGLRLMIEI